MHSFVQWFNGEICHRHFFSFCISIIVLCNRTFTVLLSNLLLWFFSSIFFSSLSNRFLRVLVYYYCNSILSFDFFLLLSFIYTILLNSSHIMDSSSLIFLFLFLPITFLSLYYLLPWPKFLFLQLLLRYLFLLYSSVFVSSLLNEGGVAALRVWELLPGFWSAPNCAFHILSNLQNCSIYFNPFLIFFL